MPENEPENGFWFTLVPEQIVAHLGLDGVAELTFYAATVRTSDKIELPIAATKTKSFAIPIFGLCHHLVWDRLCIDRRVSCLSLSGWQADIWRRAPR